MYSGYRNVGLEDAEDNSLNVELPIPEGVGNINAVIQESTEFAGLDIYLDKLDKLSEASITKPPAVIPVKSGWQMWNGVRWVEGTRPADGSTMVADFETVQQVDGKWYPTMLVCATSDLQWYVWQWSSYVDFERTVAIGNNQTIIGHNIPYDRSYFTEEYLIADSGNRYYDTMGAFISVRGMGNQQRALFQMPAQAPWKQETTSNGLSAVHKFYTGIAIDKSFRDSMVTMTPEQVMNSMPQALEYCLEDVYSTWQVFRYVLAEWKVAQPSRLSQAGQMLLGNVWLPMSVTRYPDYEAKAEKKYVETMEVVQKGLNEAYELFCQQWLSTAPEHVPLELQYLDWTPAKTGKRKGLPAWYRETKVEELTLHSRLVPTILRLKYKGEFLYWDKHPTKKTEKEKPREGWRTASGFMENIEDANKTVSYLFSDKLVKTVEAEVLTTDSVSLREILGSAISCVNWISLRKRVSVIRTEAPEGFPVVVPAICVLGTVTRRMADSTWQCAPNAKSNRIGTELKSLIEVPKPYIIVGADVDGQEAWIASLMADVALGYCGASTFGLTMLVGQKKYKTDIHSVIAQEVGIDRGLAKNIFYGLLYGLALKGVKEYIAKSNASLSTTEVQMMSEKLIRKVKGIKVNGRWFDGLGSDAFNYMEHQIASKQPRSTVLKAALTRSLAGNKDFKTSQINWC